MLDNFLRCLTLSKASEGGYSNDKHDDGGPTMKGITIAVFREYLGNPNATIEQLKAISDQTVAAIYKTNYWDKANCDALPLGLDYAVFDYALNSGPSRPVKALQRLVMVEADGAIGPATMGAIARYPVQELITNLNAERLAFMKRARNDKGELLWATFGRGWAIRVDNVQRDASAMVGKPVTPTAGPSVILPQSPVQPRPDNPGAEGAPAVPKGFLASLVAFVVRLFGWGK